MRLLRFISLVFLFGGTISHTTAQNNQIDVTISTIPPTLDTLSEGQGFQVTVELQGTGTGYGYSASILYDADILDVNLSNVPGLQEIAPAVPGVAFPVPPTGQNTSFVRNDVVENDPDLADAELNDRIEVAFTYLAPAEPVTQYNGSLFTITFLVKSVQATSIQIQDLQVIEVGDNNQIQSAILNFTSSTILNINGGSGTPAPVCNFNNICDNALGESNTSCPSDCPVITVTEAPITVTPTPPPPPPPPTTPPILFVIMGILILVGFILIGMFTRVLSQNRKSKKK